MRMNHIKVSLLLIIMVGLTFAKATYAVTCDQAIIDKIVAMYNLDSRSNKIEILSNPLKSAAVTADNITVHPLTSKEPLGMFTVMVRVSQGGEVVESGQVRMKIRRFADVLVLSGKIRSREPLYRDRLVIRRMDITSLREKPLKTIDEIEGYRARRNLRKGKILTASAIEPIPDIETGRELSIVYVDGLCRVTSTGVALQSGVVGEYVKVKNNGSGKIILGRVIDGSTVAVDP